MLEIRSILVPVDFSGGSAEALRCALALRRGAGAIARGARVEVAHAIDLEAAVYADGPHAASAARNRARERLRAFVADVEGEAEPDVETVVLGAEPRAGIPAHASKFDLVVIGATGVLSPLELVPGGVAEAVVRRSPAPVLTVKWRALPAAPDAGRVPLLHEIVFATDFTAFSARALAYAMGLAFVYGARLTALHVVDDPRAAGDGSAAPFPLHRAIDAFYESEVGWRRDELGRFVRDRLHLERPVEVRESVRAGRPAEAIAAECRARSADLLVMATHGRSGLRRLLLGSVAERALQLAPCPVLTVRPGEESP
jgi:nucleotide-binding universal stress UspA family protein